MYYVPFTDFITMQFLTKLGWTLITVKSIVVLNGLKSGLITGVPWWWCWFVLINNLLKAKHLHDDYSCRLIIRVVC